MATYVNFEGVARVNKRRLYQLCKKYVNASNINIVILCILIMFFKGFGREKYDFSSFFDVSIIFSFFLLFVCEVLANIISSDMEFEFDVVSVAGTGGRSFGRVDGSSFLFYYIQQYECTSE